MDSSKLNDWMQGIGIFALVASLIFVGLQMKQTHEIALSQAYQARASTVAEVVMEMASNEHAMSAFLKGFTGQDDSVTGTEQQAGFWSLNAVMSLYENAYYQYQLEFLPEDHWLNHRESLKNMMTVNSFWRSSIRLLSPGLRPAFKDVLGEIDAEVRKELGE